MTKQEEAQKLLDEYVEFTLFWQGETILIGEGKRILARNKCNTVNREKFFAGTCCEEHITARKKFQEFKVGFQKIWPEGFGENFPHSYGQTGFFQQFVKTFNLSVDPNRIGLIWVQKVPWTEPTTPAQHWNTPSKAPRCPD